LQRLNVAVTRAKYLMIVIGNPETLQKDRNWYQFVKYCYDNRACKGSPFKMKGFVEKPAQDDADWSEEITKLEIN
jgi:helicase MOV-10